MAFNTKPLFPIGVHVTWPILTLADADYDGASSNVVPLYLANQLDDIVVIRFRPLGTMGATSVKLFVNNGLTNLTATNNGFLKEIKLPAVTAVAGTPMKDVTWVDEYLSLPAGFLLYGTLSVARSPGWQVIPSGREFSS